MKVNYPVKLSECKIEGFGDLVNWLFENLVFFRWNYFKNNPRGNLLLIRSGLVTSLFGIVYYFFFSSFDLIIAGVDVDPIIILGVAITVGYWNMASSFAQKSAHCSQLYMEFLRYQAGGNSETAAALGNFLSTTILTTDLWAHRAFAKHFAKSLELAAEGRENSTEIITKINSGKFNAKDVRDLIG